MQDWKATASELVARATPELQRVLANGGALEPSLEAAACDPFCMAAYDLVHFLMANEPPDYPAGLQSSPILAAMARWFLRHASASSPALPCLAGPCLAPLLATPSKLLEQLVRLLLQGGKRPAGWPR
jgi:hypothetical protein